MSDDTSKQTSGASPLSTPVLDELSLPLEELVRRGARQLIQLEFAGALYHITARGDRREPIYDDDRDRETFHEVLAEVVERFNWLCHAYCLMTNHYHLGTSTSTRG